MESMVDRVVQAIEIVLVGTEDFVSISEEESRRIALAVIAAMREPTEEMVKASYEWSAWAGDKSLREAGIGAWRAMIDAALTSSNREVG